MNVAMKRKYLIAGIGQPRLAMNFAVLIMPLPSQYTDLGSGKFRRLAWSRTFSGTWLVYGWMTEDE